MRKGMWPVSRPDMQMRWPLRASSSPISAPEFPAPAISTAPGLQLRGAAIGAGMQLHDVRVEIAGKVGNARRLVVGHRHDHVRGVELKVARPDEVAVVLALDALDPGACVHRQLKSGHIGSR